MSEHKLIAIYDKECYHGNGIKESYSRGEVDNLLKRAEFIGYKIGLKKVRE